MQVSDKLAVEFNAILLSHTITLLLLISFSAYIYFRAKKSALLYSYLSVVAMIALWMVSKILKTVSPVIELRWLFIVTQYFSIDFLSVCVLVFAFIYKRNKLPSRNKLILWLIPPLLSFFALVTNPLHMTFYSYFDIYKDRFGFSFYIAQSVQYLYLIVGAFMLSQGFTKQPSFHGKRNFGSLFAVIVLLPLIANIYYILFKLSVFSWIFSFPIFDFSPIAASISLILFTIPALTFRFFDTSPISLGRLYDIIPQGIIFADSGMRLYGCNRTFLQMLHLVHKPVTVAELISSSGDWAGGSAALFSAFVTDEFSRDVEITLAGDRCIKITKNPVKNGHTLLCFNDITEISKNRFLLSEQNRELERVNRLLDNMAQNARELAIARTKAQMAQNVHDILGHSLTVVIGTAELASGDSAREAKQKMIQMEELLTGSLNDLRNTFRGKGMEWGQTTLIKAIHYLKNASILVEVNIHGKAYELSGAQTEAIYRLCQEAITNAIKHGMAQTIYIILRYQPDQVEIYAIDNGKGCTNIEKCYGLKGIEKRFQALSGSVRFSSDGESGFTIFARLPKQSHY